MPGIRAGAGPSEQRLRFPHIVLRDLGNPKRRSPGSPALGGLQAQ